MLPKSEREGLAEWLRQAFHRGTGDARIFEPRSEYVKVYRRCSGTGREYAVRIGYENIIHFAGTKKTRHLTRDHFDFVFLTRNVTPKEYMRAEEESQT